MHNERNKYTVEETTALARGAASCDKGDAFLFVRTVAHLRSGAGFATTEQCDAGYEMLKTIKNKKGAQYGR